MILNVSSRCDIPAFFSEWFINRLKEGYVDVRNPFYPKNVSRIILDNVDCIVFCTKNPIPMFKYLDYLDNYNYLFFVTLTPYLNDIEVNVVNKRKILTSIIELSKRLCKDRVIVRYDPIILNNKYTVEFHKNAFLSICKVLKDYVNTIISFVDIKKNVVNNMNYLNLKQISSLDVDEICRYFGEVSHKYGINIQTCAENYDLEQYGFTNNSCINQILINNITGLNKKYKKSNQRDNCSCIKTVDIGAYNCCNHFCKYCYANYDEKQVFNNICNHDKNSSLLIGHLMEDDVIKIRRE